MNTSKCDVTDTSQLQSFIKAFRQGRYKIKDVVQCAMVIRVSNHND